MTADDDPWKQWTLAAKALLEGYSDDSEFPARKRYLSEQEDEHARVALATLLTSKRGAPDEILRLLANLFVPDEYLQHGPVDGAERKIFFRFRSKARRHDGLREGSIAQRIFEEMQRHPKVENAVAVVSAESGLTESAVWKIWARNKVIWE